LRENYRVVVTHRHHPIKIPGVLNLPLKSKDDQWLKHILRRQRPEIVIYLGGPGAQKWVEQDTAMAERLHSSLPGEILKATETMVERFIYVSACSVFDGTRGNYKETDPQTASSLIGKYKAGAENWIKGHANAYTILRLSPLLGRSHPYRPSWFDEFRIQVGRKERIELHNNDYFSHAPVNGACEMIERLIERAPKTSIYHYGGLNRLTTYELGCEIAKQCGWDTSLIFPRNKQIHELKPLDYSLNTSEAIKTLGVSAYAISDTIELLRSGKI
jgi:dTDP-4-dehydrorhamnose reductase